MNLQSRLCFLIAAALISACTVTGPADDGFANSQESVSIGRLFSDDDTGFTVYRSRKQQADPAGEPNRKTLDASEFEFRAFEEWSEARKNNTPAYQKFKLWQEFESFQRWREQQSSD